MPSPAPASQAAPPLPPKQPRPCLPSSPAPASQASQAAPPLPPKQPRPCLPSSPTPASQAAPPLPPKLRVCIKLKLRCVWGGGGGLKAPVCLLVPNPNFKPSCASSVKLTINFQGHGVLSVTPILNNTMTFWMNGVILACRGCSESVSMRLETTLNWLSVLTPPFHHSLLLLTLLRLCAELWKSVEVKSCHHMLCRGVLRLSVYMAYIATLWPILRQNMCTRYLSPMVYWGMS